MKTKILYLLLPSVIIFSLLSLAIFIYRQNQSSNPDLDYKNEQLSRLGKITVLPEEVPEIYIISNPSELIGKHEFYKDVSEGDILFTFASATKAIIYSPIKNLVVNAGPYNSSGDSEFQTEAFEDRYIASQKEYWELNKIAPYKYENFAVLLSDKLPAASEIESDYGEESIGFDDDIFINFFAGQYTFYQNKNGTIVFNSFYNYFDEDKYFTLVYDKTTYIFFKPDSRLLVIREEPNYSSEFNSSRYSNYDYIYTYFALDEGGTLNYLGSYVIEKNSFVKIVDEEAEKNIRDGIRNKVNF